MRVLFLTKYDRLAANTRYRCLQYIPHLKEQAIHCEVSPLLDDDYLKYRFSQGGFKFRAVARAYLRRLRMLARIREFDTVILHYELFPYFPAFFEWLLKLFRVKYICDYDDAIFHQYDNHHNFLIRFFLRNKISKVIRYSSAVLAGNDYLAQYAMKSSNSISIVPTVVDPKVYTRVDREKDPSKPFTIGWIGSPSTAEYVKEKAQALRQFCLKYHAQVTLVGSGPIEIPGLPLEIREWTESTELDELRNFDVGIMPLPDNPWTRGKCGFKLIQYMACRLPTLASPVGVNQELVDHGKTGYLATTDQQWIEALEKLYHSSKMRQQMGEAGFQKIKQQYSLPVFAPKLASIVSNFASIRERIARFKNIDEKVTEAFGDEWAYFQQDILSFEELKKIFLEYFTIFPWNKLPKSAVGADIGCGSGRWAKFVAPKVKHLHCLDASHVALEVARTHLSPLENVSFNHASIGELPFEDGTLDFAYCIGVLHHVPDPEKGMQVIASKLKPGAPFLFYIYYAFENRSPWYRWLWKVTDLGRIVISRLPFKMKFWISQFLAISIYWPLARVAKFLATKGILPKSWTLSYYRDKAFYVMRNDALDRFGTRLEKRFTQEEIRQMLTKAGFKDVTFSSQTPYWVGVAIRE